MASKNNSKAAQSKGGSNNEWDQRPAPSVGDNNRDVIATARGWALNNWEEFEVSFAALFYRLVRAREFAILSRAYSSIATFRGRSEMVYSAFDAHFIVRPDDVLEEHVRKFRKEVDGYAARRNEIAHGIVMEYNVEKHGNKIPGVLLYPSTISVTKRHLVAIPSKDLFITKAKYGYGSSEINYYSEKFEKLHLKTNQITDLVIQSHQKKPKRPKSPT